MAIGRVIEGTYGVIAEFGGPEELLRATEAARDAGFTEMDAFSPFPIHGLHEALGMHHTKLPMIVLGGGIIGGVSGFFICWDANMISYPINIGGKALNSWASRSPV